MSDEIKREMTGEQEQQGSETSVDHRGLYNKFRVERRDGKAKHKDCTYFVLDLNHDPHAWPALDAYAEHCKEDRPELAADLRRMTDPNLAGLNYEPIATRSDSIAIASQLAEALNRLVIANEEWNADVAQIVGRMPKWTDGYLDKARAALDAARKAGVIE